MRRLGEEGGARAQAPPRISTPDGVSPAVFAAQGETDPPAPPLGTLSVGSHFSSERVDSRAARGSGGVGGGEAAGGRTAGNAAEDGLYPSPLRVTVDRGAAD